MPKNSENNKDLATVGPVLFSTGRLSELLDYDSIMAFSQTCWVARDVYNEARKKSALKSLLKAVVEGNEALARAIITYNPELLLDSSVTVTDLSGKEIKGLTSIQAAICAGDVEMVQMMRDVLQQKLRGVIHLSFEPEYEIQRQFETIYPNGDIDSVETEQKIRAQEFKTSKLNKILAAINAATDEQIKFELKTPGHPNANSPLNKALRNFRAQFADLSNQEKIFNPFYLLMAFELYHEQYNNLKSHRNFVFWQQVIGYTQRYLPACYWQAFAQGLFNVVENGEELRRDFKLQHGYNKGLYTPPSFGDLKLGYRSALGSGNYGWGRFEGPEVFGLFQKLLQTKKSGLKNLFSPRNAESAPKPRLKSSCVIS